MCQSPFSLVRRATLLALWLSNLWFIHLIFPNCKRLIFKRVTWFHSDHCFVDGLFPTWSLYLVRQSARPAVQPLWLVYFATVVTHASRFQHSQSTLVRPSAPALSQSMRIRDRRFATARGPTERFGSVQCLVWQSFANAIENYADTNSLFIQLSSYDYNR